MNIPHYKELKKLQDKLVDDILTKPDQLKKMIEIQLRARDGYYQYSLNNLILANYQHYIKTGEGIELLAPYKVWEQKGRQVKKGEKSLRVLAPVFKKYTDDNDNEEKEYLAYFMRVPVFDLSQTTGEPLETDFTHSEKNFTLEEIINRGNVKVNFSNKQLTRGYTNGKEIWISKHTSTNKQICTYFHELAHYKLHFGENREELDSPTKELEAEAVSFIVSSYIGIIDDEAAAYILHWTTQFDEERRNELIKGKGNKVLSTATSIINQLNLNGLIDSKNNLVQIEQTEVEA